MKEGRKGGREGGREEGKKGGRKEGRKKGRKRGKEGRREERKTKTFPSDISLPKQEACHHNWHMQIKTGQKKDRIKGKINSPILLVLLVV